MSEWKSGEPTEDGWYWVWDRSGASCGDVRCYFCDGGFWQVGDMSWASSEVLADGWFPAKGFLWQGPLTPPDPPEK